MNNRGSITISLSLSLLVIICFMFILIEGSRISVAKSESKLKLNMATESFMGEYDPNIFSNYHIFVFDRGYGEKEVNLNKIRYNLAKLFNASIKYENEDTEDSICIELDDVSVNFIKSISNGKELKNQACKYMKYNISDTRKERIKSMLISNDNSVENILWIEYLLKHFKSYLDRDKVDVINRGKIYELEYLVFGCDNDNDNYEKSMQNLRQKSMCLNYSNYETNIVELLCKVDKSVICKRVVDLIIENTNRNYGTNIMKYNCYFGVEIESTSSIDAKVLLWKLSNAAINSNFNRYEYRDKKTFCY